MKDSSEELPTTRGSKASSKVSGVDLGQRRLNGPQTTGRDYRDLSEPSFEVRPTNNVAIPVGERLACRIPLVPGARHLPAGHRPRLVLASSDAAHRYPTVQNCTHVVVREASRNKIFSTSQLWLPVLPREVAA